MTSIATLGIDAAAKLLLLSEDALRRKARAGLVPGAKIGRQWVFVEADLIELIRQQAQERMRQGRAYLAGVAARRRPSLPDKRALDASLARLRAGQKADSRTAHARLDARLAQLEAHPESRNRRRAAGGRFARTS